MLKYGITLEQRDAMLADQGGCCAICKTTEPGRGKAWNVDHCHATGQVRGLLCVRCNFVRGHAKDNVDVLVNAAVYLERAMAAGMAPKIPTQKLNSRVRRAVPGGGSVDTSMIRPDDQAPRITPTATRLYGKVPGPAAAPPFAGGGFGAMGNLTGS